MGLTAQLVIRDARADEQAALGELTLAAYEQYAQLMAPANWAGLRQALVAALANNGPLERIVAVRDGDLLGSVMLCPPAGSGAAGRMIWPELRLLAVAPAARGQGIGAALIDECIQRSRRAGVSDLGLYTSDIMQSAMQLYERKGFERVPEYDFSPGGDHVVKAYRLRLIPNSEQRNKRT
jgi:GNAT superfamily N-acetyltransferase